MIWPPAGSSAFSIARAFSWSADERFLLADLETAQDKREDNIWLLPLAGGEMRQLTDFPGRDGNPTFAPDGTLIAYMWDDNGKKSLWVMTPDGRRIAYASDRAGNIDIWIMTLDEQALRRALELD